MTNGCSGCDVKHRIRYWCPDIILSKMGYACGCMLNKGRWLKRSHKYFERLAISRGQSDLMEQRQCRSQVSAARIRASSLESPK